ncbi:hypothetical protein [Carboxylicivirga marina]|uniref:hypothetical protein n=1 Tax=Carboxylicivirga marina TaxID=2800988 RepID=UPI00259135BA|nr:hypothetical protein [uncultured Carboxylicivirga sp.]
MKYLLFATLLVSLMACSKQPSPLANFEQYFYEPEKLQNGKVFTFQKVSTLETVQILKKHVHKNGKKLIATIQSTSGVVYDSTLIEPTFPYNYSHIYRFDYDSSGTFEGLSEGTIKKDEVTDNGMHSIFQFKHEDILYKIDKEQEYVCDTTYIWKGEALPAIYFKYTNEFKSWHKYLFFLSSSHQREGYFMYAKGLGVVKYGSVFNGVKEDWELKDIR